MLKSETKTKSMQWSELLDVIGGDDASSAEMALNSFAVALRRDREYLLCGDINSISMAAKWAPTENSSHDRKTKSAHLLANLLDVNMRRYRKLYISPLRRALVSMGKY